MAIKVTFPDGEIKILPKAVRVDQTNYHEGMYDFYDEQGNLLEQISLDSKIKWEETAEIQDIGGG